MKQNFNQPLQIRQVVNGYSVLENIPIDKGVGSYAGLSLSGYSIISINSWPPPFISPNAIYIVGDVNGEKNMVIINNNKEIIFNGTEKQYRFFNSNNEQIG